MSGSPETSGNRRPERVPVVVCADDYGMSPAIGGAIRELLAKGRLSATSCMTPAMAWPAEGPLLKPLRPKIGVGLHFTLTELSPITRMPDLAPQPLDLGCNRSKYRSAAPFGLQIRTPSRGSRSMSLMEDLTHVTCIAFFQPAFAWF